MMYTNEDITRKKYSFVIWILIVGFCAAAVWAYYSKLDQTTRAQGTVITSSRIQVIQAVDDGALKSIMVKEGDKVEKGQVLAVFDQIRVTAAVKELDARLAALQAKAARLKAELTDASSVSFPKEISDFSALLKAEQALFVQKKRSINEEVAILQTAVRITRSEAKLIAELAKTGDVSNSEVLRAEKALNEAEGKLVTRKNAYYEDARVELAKVEDEIAQSEQVRAQRAKQLTDSFFTAPCAGIVKNVRITTTGGVLRTGDELMQIVPLDDRLIVEAKIRPADIADLTPGLRASIRFDSFDYSIYGAVEGELLYISADTLKEETPSGVQTYYRAHIGTSGNPVVTLTGKKLDILSGMTATVDIKTGERTVLDVLLKPLKKTLYESFSER